MATLFLAIVYYAGIAACGMLGVEKSQNNHINPNKYLICAFLSAFAGGLIRDIIFLKTYPAILRLTCIPDITIALVAAYIYYNKKTEYLFNFLFWADTIALARFIAIGVDKAISMEADTIIIFISGVTTALGGGIISSLFCREPIREIFLSNISYRLSVFIGTAIYIYWEKNQVKPLLAQYLLVIYTATVCNTITRGILKKFFLSQLHNIQKAFKSCTLTMYGKSSIFAQYCFNKALFNLPLDSYNYNSRRMYFNYANKKIIVRFYRVLKM